MRPQKSPDIVVIGDSDEERANRRSCTPPPPDRHMALPLRAGRSSTNSSTSKSSTTALQGSNRNSVFASSTLTYSKSTTTTLSSTPRKRLREQDDMLEMTASQSRQVKSAASNCEVIDIDEPELPALQNNTVPKGATVIDLEELVEQFDAEFEAEQALPPNQAAKATNPMRNPRIAFPWVALEVIKVRDLLLKVGRTIELTSGEFLHLTKILKNSVTMIVKLRGWRLKRCKEMGGSLLRKRNELCYVHEVLLDDPRPMLQQSILEVGLEDVVKLRGLICTNSRFPEHRPLYCAISRNEEESIRHILENELLIVRWKHITFYDNAQEQAKSPAYQGNIRNCQLLPLNEDECTSAKHYASPEAQRRDWRGTTTLGGSHNGQKYTYGDAFCGAGGATRGAVDAGFHIRWGLDRDCNTGKTWRPNFRDAKHFEMWAHEFVALPGPRRRYLVDVLHLSPPCQVFSPVHTREGKNDEQNFFSLFACGAIIEKCRPRIVTLEQTFGILHPKFRNSFHSLIHTFTALGYSISWQTVHFPNYGLAQSRRRLIIVAAAPGEALPELPPYTHSNSPFDNLKPYNSVRNALSRIPRNAENHDVEAARRRGGNKAAWDDSGIATCITCDGGNKGHPSGLRDFTEREIATLQSFPQNHIFYGNAIRQQIGNAVPPLIAKIIFLAIIKHLKKQDGMVREAWIVE